MSCVNFVISMLIFGLLFSFQSQVNFLMSRATISFRNGELEVEFIDESVSLIDELRTKYLYVCAIDTYNKQVETSYDSWC